MKVRIHAQHQLPRLESPKTTFITYAASENVSRFDVAFDIPLDQLADQRSSNFEAEQARELLHTDLLG